MAKKTKVGTGQRPSAIREAALWFILALAAALMLVGILGNLASLS